MNAGISRWATWTAAGVAVRGASPQRMPGPIGAWPDAPLLSKIHPKARRPHPQAKALVQLASVVLGDRRIDGLALTLGSASGSAAPDREFDRELKQKGAGFGSPSLFVYTLPSAPLGKVGTKSSGGNSATDRLKVWVFTLRLASLTSRVKVELPVALGVPEMLALLPPVNFRPLGKVPLASRTL